MNKRKNESNWNIVLIIALLFIIIGAITCIIQFKQEQLQNNNILKGTKKEEDNIEIKEEDNTEIKEEDNKDNKSKEEEFKNQEGDTVKIEGDKIVSATGFAGASNYKFYLKGSNLYFKNISKDNEEELIATGVKDLYLENKEVVAELLETGKIVKENNYITYK